MAEFPLTTPQRKQLIDYLVRYGRIRSQLEREAFLADSGLTEALGNLRYDLLVEGTERDFAHALINVCQRRGTVADIKRPALVLVLQHLQEIASGHEQVVELVEHLLNSVPQTSTSLAATQKSEEELWEAFDHAINYQGQQEWNQALDILLELQRHNFDALGNLELLIDDIKTQRDKTTRSKRQTRAYYAVARIMANQTPEAARLTWNDFLRQYPEFDPLYESDYISPPNVEQKRLLDLMQDISIPPIQRAEAGRELARQGDPRSALTTIDNMQFCYVPAGDFWLGSDAKDSLSFKDETPINEYNIPYYYWIGRFPVTNAQFEMFIEDNGYKNKDWWSVASRRIKDKIEIIFQTEDINPSEIAARRYTTPFRLSNHPVVGISWYEAIAFTEWLTKRWQDKGYISKEMRVTLPSEAEWEKAARGGIKIPTQSTPEPAFKRFAVPTVDLFSNPYPKRRYPYDQEISTNKSNYKNTEIKTTNALGIFGAGRSPYGCEEMSGNVEEWMRNAWKRYPYQPDTENTRLSNVSRAVRGGTFGHSESFVRCTNRDWYGPLVSRNTSGMRVIVMDLSLYLSPTKYRIKSKPVERRGLLKPFIKPK